MASDSLSYTCDESTSSMRLDQALLQLLAATGVADMSRSRLQKIVERGGVVLNGEVETRPGCRLKAGDQLIVTLPEAEPSSIVAQEIPLDVLYEDGDLMSINKSAGLTVHPGAGQRDGTLLNALAHYLQQDPAHSELERPWIVHRIDRDTSGVLVIARNDRAHRNLSQQFHDRTVEKEYLALVLATPRQKNPALSQDQGVIELPIGRHRTQRTRMAINAEQGRRAVTRWSVVERFDYGALLKVQIETGRTHQIRLHLEAIGAPVIGDPVYGNFQALPKNFLLRHQQFGRQALHAHRLSCTHPVTGVRLQFEAPIPEDMSALVRDWRNGL